MHSGTSSPCTHHLVPVEMQMFRPLPDLLQVELCGWGPEIGFEGALQVRRFSLLFKNLIRKMKGTGSGVREALGVNSLARCEALVKKL